MLMQENERDVVWVPRSMKLDHCMAEFLERQSHIAVVFDDTAQFEETKSSHLGVTYGSFRGQLRVTSGSV